ncbi:unnamed protein product [Oikopleura dioica]|uniref:Uncharacterized protein n=1 Tax=Oikopleura dioica TaxID=34765 RepID=E4XXB1_OIKDI|nr:unnamed protein product [Oikopleura dioica]
MSIFLLFLSTLYGQPFLGVPFDLPDQEGNAVLNKRSPYFVKEQLNSMLNDCLVQAFTKSGPNMNIEVILDYMALCEKKATSSTHGQKI